MSSASDYMVGNAPQGASYAAPLVGQQIGQQLAGLPDAYFQGQKQQRELAVMNAFPSGIPTDPQTGQPDLNQIMGRLSKAGGGEYIQQLMPFLIKQQIGQQAGAALGGIDSSAPPSNTQASAGSPAGTGPSNLTPRPQSTPPVSSPAGPAPTGPMSSTGMDNNGADTIRTLATGAARGQDATNVIGSLVRQFRINPDAPLTPAQSKQVHDFLGNTAGVGAGKRTASADDTDNTPQDTTPPQGQNAGPPFARNMPPPPASNQAQAAQAPPQSRGADSALGSEAQLKGRMDLLNSQAQRIETYAASVGPVNPEVATAALAKAKALREQASQIFTYIQQGDQAAYEHELKNQDLTQEQKNAAASSAPGQPPLTPLSLQQSQEAQKILAASRGKKADAYNTQGEQADKALDMNKVALNLANSPDFISGAGKGFQDAMANLSQSLGFGQSASIGQIFDKLRSSTILDGIKAMAGTGPVRVAEMKVIETASGDRANQAEAVRAVLVMQQRAYQKEAEIRNVVRGHGGIIDDAAEKEIGAIQARPLFTPAEYKDPHALGAPTFNSPQDLAAAHLPPNSPWRAPNGEIRYTH